VSGFGRTTAGFSSAPISNKQFRPRRIGSGNAKMPSGTKTSTIPTRRSTGQLGSMHRNARAGKLYHHAGSS